jgi:predicted nuclease of predicted toxin-antitoxin system
MPKKIQFHLDENVSNAIADGLRRRGIDVTTTPEQGLISVSDEEQLEFALTHNRVIFTQDTDFLRLHQANFQHAGIIYCSQGSRSIGEIIRSLIMIWELLDLDEMSGRVEFI